MSGIEVELGGDPIFIDVRTGAQYQLLSEDDVKDGEQNTPPVLKNILEPDTSREEFFPAQSHKIMSTQNHAETQQKEVTTEISAQILSNMLQMDVPIKEHPPKTSDQDAVTAECIKIDKRRIRCPECQRFTAETEEKMLRHIRKVHRGENPFQCYMCDYSTYNKCLFEEHVRIHQGIKPYKCSHCPYRSVSKKNTKKHELIHRPDNPLKCDLCNFIARHSKSLSNHKKLKHKDGMHAPNFVKKDVPICKYCNTQYETFKLLRNHQKKYKQCPECQLRFCTTHTYSRHLKESHNLKQVLKKKHNKVAERSVLFKCKLCKWSSNHKPRILLHLIHHPNQIVPDTIDITVLKQCGIIE